MRYAEMDFLFLSEKIKFMNSNDFKVLSFHDPGYYILFF